MLYALATAAVLAATLIALVALALYQLSKSARNDHHC